MLEWSDLTVIEGQGRPALQILTGDPPQEHFLVECGILLLVKVIVFYIYRKIERCGVCGLDF